MRHIACYGSVKILRDVCPECKRTAFVTGNEFACCGAKATLAEPRGYKRECETDNPRAVPSKEMQRKILDDQQGRCFYCERVLGWRYKHKGKLVTLRTHWDHLVPYSYLQSNDSDNFVAACHICNGIKGSLMFQTVEEARVYVNIELQKKTEIDGSTED
jgi:5-methylcytosine-specific restriction endonuclease McrA